MKGMIIFLLILLAGGYIWYAAPWEESRYDETKQGVEAKKTDKIVDQAIAFPNIWEAREMLSAQPTREGHKMLAFGSHDEFTQLVESLYSAGAKRVCFAYITRGPRSGDQAEGLFAELPADPAKRKALFNIAQNWENPPKDVNQKYIYYRIQGWDPNAEEKSFLGT